VAYLAVTVAPVGTDRHAVGVYIRRNAVLYGAVRSRASAPWPDASADLKLGAGIDNEAWLIGQGASFALVLRDSCINSPVASGPAWRRKHRGVARSIALRKRCSRRPAMVSARRRRSIVPASRL